MGVRQNPEERALVAEIGADVGSVGHWPERYRNSARQLDTVFAGTIPSVGEGWTQRYPKEAFAVFTQIRQENLAGRGGKARARKMSATKSPRKKTARRPPTLKKGTSVKVGTHDLRGGP